MVANCKKSSFFDPIEYIRKEENLVDMEACQAVFDCIASDEFETFKHYFLLASTSFRDFKKIADVLRDESIDSEYNKLHTTFLESKAIFSIATLCTVACRPLKDGEKQQSLCKMALKMVDGTDSSSMPSLFQLI